MLFGTTMPNAISEVDEQSNDYPNGESHSSHDVQLHHQVYVD
jgi:hypothetical protein